MKPAVCVCVCVCVAAKKSERESLGKRAYSGKKSEKKERVRDKRMNDEAKREKVDEV